jgi:preprotein translocase subunit SecF
MTQSTDTPAKSSHRIRDLAGRLYRGEAGLDVVGKRKIFYGVALGIVLVFLLTIFIRPFNIGIEFRGGNAFTVPASVGTLAEARGAVEQEIGTDAASAQVVNGNAYRITVNELDSDQRVADKKASDIKAALAKRFNVDPSTISEDAVSGNWGASTIKQAIIGTVIFLVLVVVYLSLVFREWKMAVAALAALFQNLILTATVYLLTGFEVTPSTVIGFLTILGFALYDVVVVFDKVRENTRGITGNPNRTYGEAANLAVNQTLMRSINTAIVALLPVGGLLFIGAGLLGAGTLKDLGLVLFIGMLAAVYSSIFLATPVLVDLKEAEPRFRLHRQRVLQRRATGATGERRPTKAPAKAAPKQAAKSGAAAAPAVSAEADDALTTTTTPRPGARPQPRKRPSGAKPGGKPGGARSGGGRKR